MIGKEDLSDPKNVDVLMGYVLEHYIKHYDVVMKKLEHAKAATHQSIHEIEEAALKTATKSEIAEIQSYDQMWEQIIQLFRHSGVSETELQQIESVLQRIPRLIRKYYDLLVEQDKVLQNLMSELQSEEYRHALAVTQKVQAKPDLMSGLDPSEFDMEEAVQAFMFKIPKSRDSVH